MQYGEKLSKRSAQTFSDDVDPLFSSQTLKSNPDECIACMMYTTVLASSDGRVVRASDSRAVVSGLIPSRVKPMTLKLVSTAFLRNAQH